MQPADIFTLQKRDARLPEDKRLAEKKGFGAKSTENLFKAIEARRKIALDRFIYALGIRHVGETTARDLAKALGHGRSVPRGRRCAAAQERQGQRGLSRPRQHRRHRRDGGRCARSISSREPHNVAALDDLLARSTVERFVRRPPPTRPSRTRPWCSPARSRR